MTAAAIAIFALTYALIAARELKALPLGRPAGALLGAVLMVAVGVLSPVESFAAIDDGTIVLLFGMMLLTAYVEDAGFFEAVSSIVMRVCRSGWGLLVATSVMAAVLSAFLVNDTVCLFLTPLVLMVASRADLPPGPFLIGLATSANIGSAATLVGNPQNMIIGYMSGYSFADFAMRAAPAVLLALGANLVLLRVYYGRKLARGRVIRPAARKPLRRRYLALTTVVMAGVAIAFFAGFDMGYATLAGVLVLMVAERRNPADIFARVDWTLLVFFASLFVVVAGLDRTGLVERAWLSAEHFFGFGTAGGLASFTAFVTAGSNLVSNVPMTLLTGPYLGALGSERLGWVLLSYVATVAGNLTLVGSVANIIVAERAASQYRLGYIEYLKFGVVSTIVSLAVGVPAIVLTCGWRA